jgi:hypothetical protein
MALFSDWKCQCGATLRAFFKDGAEQGHVEHVVECPKCGISESLTANPYRLDKQIGENSWETVWEE